MGNVENGTAATAGMSLSYKIGMQIEDLTIKTAVPDSHHANFK